MCAPGARMGQTQCSKGGRFRLGHLLSARPTLLPPGLRRPHQVALPGHIVCGPCRQRPQAVSLLILQSRPPAASSARPQCLVGSDGGVLAAIEMARGASGRRPWPSPAVRLPPVSLLCTPTRSFHLGVCLGLNCVPCTFICWRPNPSPSEWDRIWRRGHKGSSMRF